MKQHDNSCDANDGGSTPLPGDTSFRFVGDHKAHSNRALPGIYKITFPVCEVQPAGNRFRLYARMLMSGPLECEVPRKLDCEVDVTGDFASLCGEFRRLGVLLSSLDGVDEACKAVLARVEHSYAHRYVDEHGESKFTSVLISPEEVRARLNGLSPSARQMRISLNLLPWSRASKGGKRTPADRKRLARELIAWATILRCEATPWPDRIGYEIKWEVHIDNYLDNPLIHRWTQHVDSILSYEELRRDLEVLGVDLNSYQDIQKACAKALGQNVNATHTLEDIVLAKRSLFEHFTEKPHQLPPLYERMTRAEAEAYVRQHNLGTFAGNLRVMRFVNEGTPTADTESVPAPMPPSPISGRPMKPLFAGIFDSYKLVEMPVEPYASETLARVGTYLLRATHCTVRKRESYYVTHIRLEMVCAELDPPFRAVYELKRQLTYRQLCVEFRKLQVVVHSKAGVKPACKSILGDIGWVRCLPQDASDWLCQNAGMN